MKLTPKQNMIINCLQNGWELFTTIDSHTCWCGNRDGQFHFSSALFYRMVKLGLITQDLNPPFYYHLTKLGESIKTKDVQKDIYEKLSKK